MATARAVACVRQEGGLIAKWGFAVKLKRAGSRLPFPTRGAEINRRAQMSGAQELPEFPPGPTGI